MDGWMVGRAYGMTGRKKKTDGKMSVDQRVHEKKETEFSEAL
jgi:hypothetical protein